MLSFKKMYDDMENPLMDDHIISFLLDFYSKEIPIYDVLTIWYTMGLNVKENIRVNDQLEKDRLFATLFNIWKKNYANLSDDDILNFINELIISFHNQEKEIKERYIQELKTLRMRLKQMPDIETHSEYLEHMKDPLINKYGWQDMNTLSHFTYIKSNRFSLNGESLDKIEHRLYINPDSKEIEKIALLFIKGCFEKNIPFYIKYDSYSDRDDALVIYANTIYLASYIEILKQIKEEYPELKVYSPPILTGEIDGWIGYGSEPLEDDSFHGKRSEAIVNGIAKALISWGRTNGNKLINIDGISIKTQDFVIDNISEKIYEIIKSDCTMYGLNYEDLLSPSMSKRITKFVFDTLTIMSSEDISNKDGWYIPIENGKTIFISKYHFMNPYRKLIPFIKNNDPNFVAVVRESILGEGELRGIDRNVFAFDIDKRDSVFKYQEGLEQGKRSFGSIQS